MFVLIGNVLRQGHEILRVMSPPTLLNSNLDFTFKQQ